MLDRAPNFANHDLRILFGKLATKLYTLNSYHPQRHGQNTFENLALSVMPRIIIKDKHNSRDEHTYHKVAHKATYISTFEVICGLNHLSLFKLLPSSIGFMPKEKVTTNEHFQINEMIIEHIQPSKEKYCENFPKTKEKQTWQLSEINFETNTSVLFDDFRKYTFDPGGQSYFPKQEAAIRDLV